MAKIASSRERVSRAGNDVVLTLSDAARKRDWQISLPLPRAARLGEALMLAARSEIVPRPEPQSPRSGSPYDLQVRALENGRLEIAWIGPNGEIAVSVELPEAEAIFAKFAEAIAALKTGRHPTKQ